jgi:hypothetical protein
MVGQVDVLWFESMGVFSEPIFDFSFLKLTLKQVGVLFGGILISYGLALRVNPIAGLAIAGLAVLLALYQPRVMPLERYAMVAIKFLMSRRQRVAEKQNVSSLLAKGVAAEKKQPIKADKKRPKGNGKGFFMRRDKKAKTDGNLSVS